MKKELQLRIGLLLTGLSPWVQFSAVMPGQSDFISGMCTGMGLALMIMSWAKHKAEGVAPESNH